MEDHQDSARGQNPRSGLTVNRERTDGVQALLREYKLDLLICALPANVLMLSGYWPVIGTGVALASAEGQVRLLVPEDELELTESSWANEIQTFEPGSLDFLGSPATALRAPLKRLISQTALRIGLESGETSEPASYAAMHLYGSSLAALVAEIVSHAVVSAADEVLNQMRSRKTPLELERICTACTIASEAFRSGADAIAVGARETKVAESFRRGLSAGLADHRTLQRCDGFAWCMSGTNSALAYRAYARSRPKAVERGDLVLIHCNSSADGYWTDITRTFLAGEPDDRYLAISEAVFEARAAALSEIRPGAAARDVDRAAREVLRQRGFASAFRHSTGHGVGFGAISANALPRLHPQSPDVLERGMVFNVEPAVYLENYGGMRHCDMIAVTADGYELLTPFQSNQRDLVKEGR